jgi:3-hydroxyacyl-CoA dehydrogenase, C-terminal domain
LTLTRDATKPLAMCWSCGCSGLVDPATTPDGIACLSIMQVLYEGLSDSQYRPCSLPVKYVEAGWLGRKTGRGFYDYTVTPPRPTR